DFTPMDGSRKQKNTAAASWCIAALTGPISKRPSRNAASCTSKDGCENRPPSVCRVVSFGATRGAAARYAWGSVLATATSSLAANCLIQHVSFRKFEGFDGSEKQRQLPAWRLWF